MPKTPPFWYDTTSWRAYVPAMLLSPVSLIYRIGHRLHQALSRPCSSTLPVICCGNLVAGGAGKTPAALAIHKLITDHGLAGAPVFLTRGYGRRERTPRLVRQTDSDKPDARIIGDEARLLSAYGDCIVTSERVNGAKMAEKAGYDCIIMDDGLQNMRLSKNLTLCVIDGLNGLGNQRLMPAGPLRTPLSHGLERSDAFVLIGPDRHNIRALLPPDKPCYAGELVAETKDLDKDMRYIAFCGIGNPDKFRMSLENEGFHIHTFHSYGDHHNYTTRDMARLREQADETNAQLITTEKDMMRLAAIGETAHIKTLPVYLDVIEANELKDKLHQALQT